MPTANINGIELYFEACGQGQPLVFIPGLGGTTDLWYAQRALFSEHYHFISLDNLGAGRSSKPAGPYTMQQFADDLHALLEHLEVDQPIYLVGASMGGIIAQAFIHDHPQRVRKLALVCTGVSGGDSHYVAPAQAVIDKILRPGNTPEEKIDTFLEIFYHPDFVFHHPQVRDYYLSRKIEPQPAHAYMAQLGACYDPRPYYQWLGAIRVPVLVLHGRDDKVWPLENAHNLAAGVGESARLAVMEGAAHVLMQEQPEEFNRILLDFLQT